MELRSVRTASEIGTVLDTGQGDFEIIVSQTPAPDYVMCYGVFNKATRIVEALTNSFAKAKAIVTESHLDATQGYDRGPRGLPQGLQALLAGNPDMEIPGATPIKKRTN